MSTTAAGERTGVVSSSGAFASHLHPLASWDIADHPMPTGREEQWRFTPVRMFNPLMEIGDFGQIPTQKALPEGVTSRVVDGATARDMSYDPPVDLLTIRATEAEHATVFEVASDAAPTEPLNIDTTGTGARAASHTIIKVGHHAQIAIVVQRHGVAQLASKLELQVAEGARVDFIYVQDWEKGALHGGQISIRIGKDAAVRSFQADIGDGNVRMNERVQYDGEGGDLNQLGIYFVKSRQYVEHRLFVDHNYPHTVSLVDYRGALQGKGAHSVWVGDALIRKTALDIDTYETNKNLMLTEGCQADSVPNLEIETGEIRGVGHSSSTGKFDPQQLFYLCSRGIPEEKARRLVVEGFFLDIIHRIGRSDVEARLIEALNEQLASIADLADESVLGDQQ